MRVHEMHFAVDQGLQKLGSYVLDNFLPQEIDYFLNKMQREFIQNRVGEGTSFMTGRDIAQLRPLRVDNYLDRLPQPNEGENLFFLPADFGWGISLRAEIADPAGPTQFELIPATFADESVYFHPSPYRQPRLEQPIFTLTGDTLRLSAGKTTIVKGIAMDYLRLPRQISLSLKQDCELPPTVHDDIVDLTVRHLLELIESPRQQTYPSSPKTP